MNSPAIKTKGAKKLKVWSTTSDDRYDKAHSIKEGSAKDTKLDAKRGVSEGDLQATLKKLGGGK